MNTNRQYDNAKMIKIYGERRIWTLLLQPLAAKIFQASAFLRMKIKHQRKTKKEENSIHRQPQRTGIRQTDTDESDI